jgi:diguanylate cyclase (GGDEF)-like protein
MVARLGGDEFAILMTRVAGDDAALALRCIQAFQAPFSIKGISVSIGVSIGIATTRTDGREGDALMQAADDALYQAKAAGKNTWRFASHGQPKRKRIKA